MSANRESGGIPWAAARTVMVHAGLWTGFALLLILPEGSRAGGPPPWAERVAYALGILCLTAPPAYAHFVLLERCLLRGRHALHVGLLAVMTVAWAALAGAVFQVWTGRQPGIVYLAAIILPVVLISSALKVLGEVGRQRTLIEETRAKQLQAELDLLKAQVHPHFLFNTLNNLFGLARHGAPAAADGIARLSHLLRYMIYESSRERVELEREVEQIRRLIALEKLRFAATDDIHVTLDVDADLSDVTVAPMLLVPFVENAFKHGIRRSAPSFVRVALSTEAQSVRFIVENSLHALRAATGDEPRGIGLQNVRRRLALLYPGAHDLVIGEAGGVFRVDLKLDDVSQGGRR